MKLMTPPPTTPPPVHVGLLDDNRPERLRAKLYLVWMTVITIVATIWCITLGPIAAIIALVVAKHILVALLVQAQDLRAEQEPDS